MLVNLDYVLKKAQKEHYAVGLFNTIDTDMLEAVISAAEELNSPVILGTAEVLLPYGALDLITPSIVARCQKTKVPVVLHYDHGLTFEKCIEAMHLGFTSVMYDGSASSYEDNVRDTREIVKIAHTLGCTVEGEIGHVGQADTEDNLLTDMYTTPQEAQKYVEDTGVDALAVAIGSAHGVYKKKPMLNIERLKEIRATLDTPLVLHGGSGLSDDDFKNTIREGIAKVNIFTDMCIAGANAMRNPNGDGMMDYLASRNAKVEAIKQCVMNKMKLFGSVNKA